uniref:2Fe-2S ferredoxin-type domain-containing protein n=1 Tax=Clastoptera arizonana TaxID=38151 RepID=A0A1B6DTW3_9HEMI
MIFLRHLFIQNIITSKLAVNNLFFCKSLFPKPINLKPFNNLQNFTSTLQLSNKEYKVTFVKANGEKVTAKGKEGDSLLDVVVNNNLDFDGFGACEGTLTCSTCHVVLKQEDYNKLPDKPSDEELDMLDLAYDLTDTSRLGCQIQLSKDLDGLEVRVPATVNDARSS